MDLQIGPFCPSADLETSSAPAGEEAPSTPLPDLTRIDSPAGLRRSLDGIRKGLRGLSELQIPPLDLLDRNTYDLRLSIRLRTHTHLGKYWVREGTWAGVHMRVEEGRPVGTIRFSRPITVSDLFKGFLGVAIHSIRITREGKIFVLAHLTALPWIKIRREVTAEVTEFLFGKSESRISGPVSKILEKLGLLEPGPKQEDPVRFLNHFVNLSLARYRVATRFQDMLPGERPFTLRHHGTFLQGKGLDPEENFETHLRWDSASVNGLLFSGMNLHASVLPRRGRWQMSIPEASFERIGHRGDPSWDDPDAYIDRLRVEELQAEILRNGVDQVFPSFAQARLAWDRVVLPDVTMDGGTIDFLYETDRTAADDLIVGDHLQVHSPRLAFREARLAAGPARISLDRASLTGAIVRSERHLPDCRIHYAAGGEASTTAVAFELEGLRARIDGAGCERINVRGEAGESDLDVSGCRIPSGDISYRGRMVATHLGVREEIDLSGRGTGRGLEMTTSPFVAEASGSAEETPFRANLEASFRVPRVSLQYRFREQALRLQAAPPVTLHLSGRLDDARGRYLFVRTESRFDSFTLDPPQIWYEGQTLIDGNGTLTNIFPGGTVYIQDEEGNDRPFQMECRRHGRVTAYLTPEKTLLIAGLKCRLEAE